MTDETVFSIPGMACQGCVNNINGALKDLDGISDYNIDLKTKTVRVDSTLSQQQLIAVLDSAGYKANAVN